MDGQKELNTEFEPHITKPDKAILDRSLSTSVTPKIMDFQGTYDPT